MYVSPFLRLFIGTITRSRHQDRTAPLRAICNYGASASIVRTGGIDRARPEVVAESGIFKFLGYSTRRSAGTGAGRRGRGKGERFPTIPYGTGLLRRGEAERPCPELRMRNSRDATRRDAARHLPGYARGRHDANGRGK